MNSQQVGKQDNGRSTGDPEETPRVRFAKRELTKVLATLDYVSGTDLDLGMRVLALQEELEDTQRLCEVWRRGYNAMHRLANEPPTPQQVAELDAQVREWVGKV